MRNILLFLYFIYFFPDNEWFNPPWGMEFGNLYNCKVLNTYIFHLFICNFFKSWMTPTILISSCFKMLLLGILKLRNTYILYPLVGASIRFSYSFDFVIDACGKVNIDFVLFKFVVVFLLWEAMTFYWIMWGLHNGDPMGITLFK